MFDNIFVMIQGGLGDQVCAEPVVREIRRMWPDKRIVVVGREAFFGHLDVEVFEYGGGTDAHGETLVLKTFAAEEMGISFLVHPVDFISLSTLRRILPNDRKQIVLGVGSEPSLRDHLLIHPGRTWTNRTFPVEWWQEVVDLCSGERKCALIGHRQYEEKGIVEVDCPERCVDLRDRTTIEELISLVSANDLLSNDSFPVHLAGAFDNWIYMIPTAKHPDLVLPWRKGTLYRKVCCPLRRMMSDDITDKDARSIITGKFTVRVDQVPDGLGILDYIPTPRQVLESVTGRWNRPLDGSVLWFG